MKLCNVIYISKDAINHTEQQIKDLAEQSSIKNCKLDLTGFLTFQKGMFIQYLEGTKPNIEIIWDAIKKDERHKIVNSFQYEYSIERNFPDWRMKYVSSKDNEDVITNIVAQLVETLRAPLNYEDMNSLETLIQEIE